MSADIKLFPGVSTSAQAVLDSMRGVVGDKDDVIVIWHNDEGGVQYQGNAPNDRSVWMMMRAVGEIA